MPRQAAGHSSPPHPSPPRQAQEVTLPCWNQGLWHSPAVPSPGRLRRGRARFPGLPGLHFSEPACFRGCPELTRAQPESEGQVHRGPAHSALLRCPHTPHPPGAASRPGRAEQSGGCAPGGPAGWGPAHSGSPQVHPTLLLAGGLCERQGLAFRRRASPSAAGVGSLCTPCPATHVRTCAPESPRAGRGWQAPRPARRPWPQREWNHVSGAGWGCGCPRRRRATCGSCVPSGRAPLPRSPPLATCSSLQTGTGGEGVGTSPTALKGEVNHLTACHPAVGCPPFPPAASPPVPCKMATRRHVPWRGARPHPVVCSRRAPTARPPPQTEALGSCQGPVVEMGVGSLPGLLCASCFGCRRPPAEGPPTPAAAVCILGCLGVTWGVEQAAPGI